MHQHEFCIQNMCILTSHSSLEAQDLLADRALRGSVQLGQPQA